jgi:hypothetical protein
VCIYLPTLPLLPPPGQSKVPNCIVLCVCGISIVLCFFPSSIRIFFTLYKELLEIHVIFVSSTNIRRTCKYSSSNYKLLNRQVRFAPYSTNIRRIELVRKFDRSPSPETTLQSSRNKLRRDTTPPGTVVSGSPGNATLKPR